MRSSTPTRPHMQSAPLQHALLKMRSGHLAERDAMMDAITTDAGLHPGDVGGYPAMTK